MFSGGFDRTGDRSGQDASDARSAARSAQTDVRQLNDRLDRLALINLALWSLLQDKTGLTEDDLLARVKLLDAMDGRQDHKAKGPQVTSCGGCGRPMKSSHTKCPYCGKAKKISSAFDLI